MNFWLTLLAGVVIGAVLWHWIGFRLLRKFLGIPDSKVTQGVLQGLSTKSLVQLRESVDAEIYDRQVALGQIKPRSQQESR